MTKRTRRAPYSRVPAKEAIAVGLLCMFIVGVVFLLNLKVVGPTVQADESSYLANAAAIAGHHNDHATKYHAGYSLVLSPVFLFLEDLTQIWSAVKLINALLVGLIIFGLWSIAKEFVRSESTTQIIGPVLVVSIYPMWIVLAGYAFPNLALASFFVLSVLLLIRSLNGRLLPTLGLPVVVGFLYWIHPTGMAPVLALVIAFGYAAFARHEYFRYAFLLFILVLVVFLYKYAFSPWVLDRMTAGEYNLTTEYRSFATMLASLFSREAVSELIGRIGGHLFYLLIGTLGLVFLGVKRIFLEFVVAPWRSTDDVRKSKEVARRALGIYLLLSLLGVLVLSVLLFTSAESANRLDHWMYGRYVEGVLAPVLLIGALSRSYRTVLWSIPVILICALLLWLNLGKYIGIAYFNIPGLWQIFEFVEGGVWVWAAIGIALVALLSVVPRGIAMGVVAGVFLYSSYLQIQWHVVASERATERWDVALSARDTYAPGACFAFDYSSAMTYHQRLFWFDFGFVLHDFGLTRMTAEDWYQNCDGAIFSFDRGLIERFQGVRPEAIGRHGAPTLYAKGEFEQDIYPLVVAEWRPMLAVVLRDGWHTLERNHVWSTGAATLYLPVPEWCVGARCVAEVRVSPYGVSEVRSVEVEARVISEGFVDESYLFLFRSRGPDVFILNIPQDVASVVVSLKIPDAISPYDLRGSRDRRELGVALYEVTVRPGGGDE